MITDEVGEGTCATPPDPIAKVKGEWQRGGERCATPLNPIISREGQEGEGEGEKGTTDVWRKPRVLGNHSFPGGRMAITTNASGRCRKRKLSGDGVGGGALRFHGEH